MFTYFIMYIVSAFAAFNHGGKQARSSTAVWTLVGTILTIVIGLRHHVGGDWNNYLWRFNKLDYLSFSEFTADGDIGYQLVAYVMHSWGLGLYGVNFISAILFVSGMIVLLRRQPNAWLGLVAAVPYLVLVVSMGYTRQGVAIGLVMWAIAALSQGKFKQFVFFIFFAVTFHKSAILMMAFGIFQQGKGRSLRVLGLMFAGLGVWSAFLEQATTTLWVNYVSREHEYLESQGAMVRVLLNVVPSLLLLKYRKEWREHYKDYSFWLMIALASIVSVGLVSFASTAVDRMALYFIPIQLVVFARLPFLLRRSMSPKLTTLFILLLYFAVLFVWLFFSANSRYWVPYHNIIFFDLL